MEAKGILSVGDSDVSDMPRRMRTKVLMVDDQPIIGEAIRHMLAAEEDVDFFFCEKPTEALSMAAKVNPTVILQDLVMPDVDGLTLVKFFRANPATRDVPLIVWSSKEEPDIKYKAFELGANDYMVKFPDKLEVIARLRYHSKAYINLCERNEAMARLQKSQAALKNELDEADARTLIGNNTLCVAEVSNMGCTAEAVELFIKHKQLFAPGKAVNAGGVATSGLEMTQNAMHLSWSNEEVDARLHQIMRAIHAQCVEHGCENGYINYVKGANIAGFMKVAKAMMAQGIV